MSATTAEATQGDVVRVPAWALVLMVVAAFGSYLLLQENGWVLSNWMAAHELFHDARHALGFPCH